MRSSSTPNAMTDPAPLRHRVDDTLPRRLAGGATQSQRLIHPDHVNHTASADNQRNPVVAAATSDWLHSCLGDLGMIMQIGMCDPAPRPDLGGSPQPLRTAQARLTQSSTHPFKARPHPNTRDVTISASSGQGRTTPTPMTGRMK